MSAVQNFDGIIRALYQADAGSLRWDDALGQLAEALQLWAVQIVGVDKRRGTLIYSFEGGPFEPQAAIDYIRQYRQCNPRVAQTLALETGQWMHCHKHFDEDFVATDRFYQDFLIPYGGRYMSGTKLLEDEDTVVLFGANRGVHASPLDSHEIDALEKLKGHLVSAIELHHQRRHQQLEFGVGQMIIQRLNQPVALVDEAMSIKYLNEAGQSFAAQCDQLDFSEQLLRCLDPDHEAELLSAVRSLLQDANGNDSHASRSVLRLSGEEGVATLLMLSRLEPGKTLNVFGDIPVAMITFHAIGGVRTIDAAVVAEAYDLTPAEAHVAVALVNGQNAKRIATARNVALSTIKSQIKKIYSKTSVGSQAELVRNLLDLPRH
ncbi:MAG: helix-turn-helix transcriptional regulator [Burkholderiaceae bacterium]